jgi:hypothetical protein
MSPSVLTCMGHLNVGNQSKPFMQKTSKGLKETLWGHFRRRYPNYVLIWLRRKLADIAYNDYKVKFIARLWNFRKVAENKLSNLLSLR